MKVSVLDDLTSGLQQDGIGVWFGPKEPFTEVEVVGECLRDLVQAAVLIIHMSVNDRVWRVSFPEGVRVQVPGSHTVLLLGLNGNQGRGKS